MKLRAAILFQCGATQPDYPTEGCGLYRLRDRTEKRFPSRDDVWIGIRTWNGPVDYDASDLVRRKPERIITINYSWGAGYGLWKFAKQLKAHGRHIDLACLIDPVPYQWGRWASRALFVTDSRFAVPDNIRAFASWRTVNKPTRTTPWGRDVEVNGMRVVERTVFGSRKALDKYDPLGAQIEDDSVTHTNIDDDPRVQAGVLDVLERELRWAA